MFKWLIALFKLQGLMVQETPRPDREDAPASEPATPANVPSGKIVKIQSRRKRAVGPPSVSVETMERHLAALRQIGAHPKTIAAAERLLAERKAKQDAE